jgi:hypothetical protein
LKPEELEEILAGIKEHDNDPSKQNRLFASAKHD